MYIRPIKPQMAPEMVRLKKIGGVLKYFAPVISIRCKHYKPGGKLKLSLGANFKLRIGWHNLNPSGDIEMKNEVWGKLKLSLGANFKLRIGWHNLNPSGEIQMKNQVWSSKPQMGLYVTVKTVDDSSIRTILNYYFRIQMRVW